jgi:hypothetical protein
MCILSRVPALAAFFAARVGFPTEPKHTISMAVV